MAIIFKTVMFIWETSTDYQMKIEVGELSEFLFISFSVLMHFSFNFTCVTRTFFSHCPYRRLKHCYCPSLTKFNTLVFIFKNTLHERNIHPFCVFPASVFHTVKKYTQRMLETLGLIKVVQQVERVLDKS